MRKLGYKRDSAQVVSFFMISVWSLIYLVPSELQTISAGLLPVKWWSNIVSILMFGIMTFVFFAVIFSKQLLSKSNWRLSVFGNPWLWSFLLITFIGLHFLFRPDTFGLNFALNLVILSVGLPYLLSSFHSIGSPIPIILALVLPVGLAVNWLYQLANQISYSKGPDIEFAHALSLLVIILLAVVGRTANLRWILALQGFFFLCFLFLVTTQLRLPAFIAGIFFVLHSLWQARPWLHRIVALAVNTLLAFTTWFLLSERVIIQQGALYISGRGRFYEIVASHPRTLSEEILGSGPGSTRRLLSSEIGYSNPHSSLMVLANDYGILGVVLVLCLVIAILGQIWKLRVKKGGETRVFFASIALLVSFGGLSLFTEPIETALTTLTALIVFLFILIGLAPRQKIDRASRVLG